MLHSRITALPKLIDLLTAEASMFVEAIDMFNYHGFFRERKPEIARNENFARLALEFAEIADTLAWS